MVQHELVVRQRNHLLVVVLDMDMLEAEDFVLAVTKVVAAAVQVLLVQQEAVRMETAAAEPEEQARQVVRQLLMLAEEPDTHHLVVVDLEVGETIPLQEMVVQT